MKRSLTVSWPFVALLALSLGLVAAPAFGRPHVHEERDSGHLAYIPAWGAQRGARAAFDGERYLAVWFDAATVSLRGSRITEDGSVLDVPSFSITDDVSSDDVAIASGDDVSLVVWTDAEERLRGARIAADGALLDPEGFAVGAEAGAQSTPVVAWGGGGFVVAWIEHSAPGGAAVYAARVTPDGGVLDPGGVALSPSAARAPMLSWAGAAFVLAWADADRSPTSRLLAARIGTDLVPLDEAPTEITRVSGATFAPDLACNDSACLLVWGFGWNGGGVHAVRIGPDGIVRDNESLALSATDAWYSPRAAATGDAFVVSWNEGGVVARRVAPDGDLPDEPPLEVIASTFPRPVTDTAAGNAGWLVLWSDHRRFDDDGHDAFAARITNEWELADPGGFPVALGPCAQSEPALVERDEGALLLWREAGPMSGDDVWGTLLGPDGEVVAADAVPIAAGPGRQSRPVGACQSEACLVVWEDLQLPGTYDIRGTFVGPDGAPIDPGAVLELETSDRSAWYPSVATLGGDYFVVWHGQTAGGDTRVHGTRVSATGVVSDPDGLVLSDEPSSAADVAASESAYLVAFSRRTFEESPGNASTDIYGIRIGPDGERVDAQPFVIARRSKPQFLATVASDGTDYFVAFEDQVDYYGTGARLQGMLVLADGTIPWFLFGVFPAPSGGHQVTPDLAFDGTHYVLAYGHDALAGREIYGPPALQVGWLDDSWEMAPATAAPADAEATSPRVAALAPGRVALAYQRHDAVLGVPRVKIRVVERYQPVGGPCSADDDCRDAACVDGFCCDGPCGDGDPLDCLVCSTEAGATEDGRCTALEDDSPCDDADPCSTDDVCGGGVCLGGSELACLEPAPCRQPGSCDPTSGGCVYPPSEDGSPCDDGDGCTLDDRCEGGTCVSDPAPSCEPPPPCHRPGVCVPETGSCSYAPEADGTPCDDGVASTVDDRCELGACVGESAPVEPVPDAGSPVDAADAGELPADTVDVAESRPDVVDAAGMPADTVDAAVSRPDVVDAADPSRDATDAVVPLLDAVDVPTPSPDAPAPPPDVPDVPDPHADTTDAEIHPSDDRDAASDPGSMPDAPEGDTVDGAGASGRGGGESSCSASGSVPDGPVPGALVLLLLAALLIRRKRLRRGES